MTKRKWEIWSFDFPGKGVHPVILISHPDRCERGDVINVLYCTSQKQSRPIKESEILLDSADRLDWETFVRCDLIYTVPSAELIRKRGSVTPERRRLIKKKLIAIFGLLDENQ